MDERVVCSEKGLKIGFENFRVLEKYLEIWTSLRGKYFVCLYMRVDEII